MPINKCAKEVSMPENFIEKRIQEKTASCEIEFSERMAQSLKPETYIDPSLYTKYDVKRGLRNSNGTGVAVGLSRTGSSEGYVMEEGVKKPIPGKLYYRGYDVEDIVAAADRENRFGYEETSFLLLFGHLPSKSELEEYTAMLSSRRRLPLGFTHDMILAVPSPNIMIKLARSVLALYSYDSNADDISIANVLRQSIDLIARFPAIAAYGYEAKHSYYCDESLHIHQPVPEFSTAENILHMIRPDGKFTPLEAKMLDLSMILHADHGGGNNSAFTTHVVSSTGTDTYSAIASAICSLKGPKHGGANVEVLGMIKDLKANVSDITDYGEVEEYLKKLLNKEAFDRSGLIYGLGHAVYTISDPRATVLKKMARTLAEEKGLLNEFLLYDFIERRGPQLLNEHRGTDKPVCANVDLYSGFVFNALNIPEDMAAPLFAASRISGWCAHRIEELVSGKIIRPAYLNAQECREYIPMENR